MIPEEFIVFFQCRRWQILQIKKERHADIYLNCDFDSSTHEVCVVVIRIAVSEKDHIGKEVIRELLTQYARFGHLVFIVPGLSTQAKELFASNEQKIERLEIIPVADFTLDKLNNIKVPNYELWHKSQVKAFEERRKISCKNLSKMLTTDPIAVYLGFRAGDVVYAREFDSLRYVTHTTATSGSTKKKK